MSDGGRDPDAEFGVFVESKADSPGQVHRVVELGQSSNHVGIIEPGRQLRAGGPVIERRVYVGLKGGDDRGKMPSSASAVKPVADTDAIQPEGRIVGVGWNY